MITKHGRSTCLPNFLKASHKQLVVSWYNCSVGSCDTEFTMEESMKLCAANYPPLSPIRFIERAAIVYGDSTSLVYNSTRFTWSETYQRCRRLASALSVRNISTGDVVTILIFHIIIFVGILLFFDHTGDPPELISI